MGIRANIFTGALPSELAEPEPPMGAHIVAQRRGYIHHGIYAGAGKVVHYAGLSRGLRRGPVEETSLSRFAAGHGVRVVSDVAPGFEGLEVVRRARSRIGEDNYRLLTNNCEHFCEWCLRGEPRSYQVEARLALPLRGDRFISQLGALVVKRPFSAMMMLVMVMSAVAAGAACARDVSPPDPTASPISPVQALVLNGAQATEPHSRADL